MEQKERTFWVGLEGAPPIFQVHQVRGRGWGSPCLWEDNGASWEGGQLGNEQSVQVITSSDADTPHPSRNACSQAKAYPLGPTGCSGPPLQMLSCTPQLDSRPLRNSRN